MMLIVAAAVLAGLLATLKFGDQPKNIPHAHSETKAHSEHEQHEHANTAEAVSEEPKAAAEETVTDRPMVVIETNKGKITAFLYDKEAKITTDNFVGLVNKKFYNGLVFHRVEPGFVVQTGDPKGNGTGGSGKTIPLEVDDKLKHDSAGVLGMARSSDPNSASSQFYITLDATPNLDGNYAVLGRVVEGIDVVKKIQIGDKMQSVYMSKPGT